MTSFGDVHFEKHIQQIKLSEFIPWETLHKLLDTIAGQSNPEHLHRFLNLVRDFYTRDISRVKDILSERAKRCDSLIARLQYLEAHEGNHVQEQSESCDFGLMNPHESALSQALSQKFTDGPVFDLDSSQSLMCLQLSGIVATTCYAAYRDEGSQTQLANLADELHSQNEQYLALGLAWKKKYEQSQQELKRMATERANEMQELYEMMNSLTGPGGNKR
jgi:hypothetical protein